MKNPIILQCAIGETKSSHDYAQLKEAHLLAPRETNYLQHHSLATALRHNTATT